MDKFHKMHTRTINRLGVLCNFVQNDVVTGSGKAYIQMDIDIIDGEGHVIKKGHTVTAMNDFIGSYSYDDKVIITDANSAWNGYEFKLQETIIRDGYKKQIEAYR